MNKKLFENKIILITGGTGSFGSAMSKKLLKIRVKEIRIFSRDEKKQDDMRKKFSDKRLKFYLGDVRNKESINEAKILNISRLSIETGAGDFFKPARKLFKHCGFEVCKPFAHYKEDINSVYLTRIIENN